MWYTNMFKKYDITLLYVSSQPNLDDSLPTFELYYPDS